MIERMGIPRHSDQRPSGQRPANSGLDRPPDRKGYPIMPTIRVPLYRKVRGKDEYVERTEAELKAEAEKIVRRRELRK